MPTIGVEFATKTVKLLGGEKVKAQIWDTGLNIYFFKKVLFLKQAGQERYRSITSAYHNKRELFENNIKTYTDIIEEL